MRCKEGYDGPFQMIQQLQERVGQKSHYFKGTFYWMLTKLSPGPTWDIVTKPFYQTRVSSWAMNRW